MLLVETYIDFSPGKGLGLFSNNFLCKGTQIWIRNTSFDKIIKKEDLFTLGELAILYVKKHACLEASGNWYMCGDNARFSNHSNNPNTENIFDDLGLVIAQYAAREINVGEEISCDYTKLCITCKDGIDFS